MLYKLGYHCYIQEESKKLKNIKYDNIRVCYGIKDVIEQIRNVEERCADHKNNPVNNDE